MVAHGLLLLLLLLLLQKLTMLHLLLLLLLLLLLEMMMVAWRPPLLQIAAQLRHTSPELAHVLLVQPPSPLDINVGDGACQQPAHQITALLVGLSGLLRQQRACGHCDDVVGEGQRQRLQHLGVEGLHLHRLLVVQGAQRLPQYAPQVVPRPTLEEAIQGEVKGKPAVGCV